MVTIKGGEAGSIGKLKKELKNATGGGTWVRSIPKDDDLRVRFLTEPNDWFKYEEHYVDDIGYFPCIGDGCPGCEAGDNGTKRYLANALDVESERVIPVKLPSTLANRLVTRFERYSTMVDRDYILFRTGSGLNTEYDADTEQPSRRKLDKYDQLDLEEVLVNAFEDAFGETEEDEEEPDEEPEPSTQRRLRIDKSKVKKSKSSSRRRRRR